MPVKRRAAKQRRNLVVPEWAKRLKAGVRPGYGTPECDEFAEWVYFGGEVAGLPLADSPAGQRLWRESSVAG
jgi:hypothetical protein